MDVTAFDDIVPDVESALQRFHPRGSQFLIRFPNNVGVFLLSYSGKYGNSWEVAPIAFTAPGLVNWEFIGMSRELSGFATDDVRGGLDTQDVLDFLSQMHTYSRSVAE